MDVPDRFILGLGGGIFIVWAISCIAEILSKAGIVSSGYDTPLAIHGVMGTIVGSVFTERRIRIRRRALTNDQDEAEA